MVCGRILDKYNELGGEGGALGLPTSNELTNLDGAGKRTSFTNDSSIYWSLATDAHQIGGAIGAEWARKGWEGGAHGYPTTDELRPPDNTGRYNHFQKNSSIYWHPSNGPAAFTVWGAIRDNWSGRGWEAGRFGYPTTNEYEFEGGWAQNFNRGTLDWRPGDPSRPGDVAPSNLPRGSADYRDPGTPTVREDVPPVEEDVPPVEDPESLRVNDDGETDPDGDPLPEIGCRIIVANPHDSRARANGALLYPKEIHTQVKSTCPSTVVPLRNLAKAAGYRLRWWGVPQSLPQIPKSGKQIVDGGKAAQNVKTSRTVKVVSAVACEPGRFFRYMTIGSGEYTFPNGQTDRKAAYMDNPPGGELTCQTN
ncbi:LGFP repeat-containing protein [Nocardia sp. CA-128927]|uniref:LGFP repeat-containing protein n=1 Tax=Nocardia sp. CA-128927 TaxID=3239975 RepID=UPI003D970C45